MQVALLFGRKHSNYYGCRAFRRQRVQRKILMRDVERDNVFLAYHHLTITKQFYPPPPGVYSPLAPTGDQLETLIARSFGGTVLLCISYFLRLLIRCYKRRSGDM